MIAVPKTLGEILAHADALADAFERYEPRPGDERDLRPYRALERAVKQRADAERAIVESVAAMRAARWSWSSVGAILGTTGQAAQQRYGRIRPE